MTLVPVDQIDSRLDGFCDGIGAMTELPVHQKVWGTADYLDEIERLTIELIEAREVARLSEQGAVTLRLEVSNLNTVAENRAAAWEREIWAWQLATAGMGAVLLMVLGSWAWWLSR